MSECEVVFQSFACAPAAFELLASVCHQHPMMYLLTKGWSLGNTGLAICICMTLGCNPKHHPKLTDEYSLVQLEAGDKTFLDSPAFRPFSLLGWQQRAQFASFLLRHEWTCEVLSLSLHRHDT